MTIEELVELNDTFEVLDDNTGEILIEDAEWQEFDDFIRFESITGKSSFKMLSVATRKDVRFRRPNSIAIIHIIDAER